MRTVHIIIGLIQLYCWCNIIFVSFCESVIQLCGFEIYTQI